MKQKSGPDKAPAEQVLKNIRRQTDERWHQTLKNRILLENYHLSGDLEQQIDAFVEHYNHVRYHESLNNLTPADVYFGRAETILVERERIKRATTIANRRLQHQLQSA
jgi:putative transposase